LTAHQLTNTNVAERMTTAEVQEFFDRDSELMTVKRRRRDGSTWHVGDVGEPHMLDVIGSHDIVVANNFSVLVDEDGRVLRFDEKTAGSEARHLNAGIYMIARWLLADMPSRRGDISRRRPR
jgi:hypothetical protein